MTTTQTIEGAAVSNYILTFRNVRNPMLGHRKIATMVTLSDGRVIRYMNRMSKREALRNAAGQIAREAMRAEVGSHS